MWAAGGLAAAFAPVLGVVKRNRDRSIQNARRLEGDGANGYEGLMAITKDTRERVAVLEEKMDTARRERKHEHEAVMDSIEDLGDE